MCQHLGRHQTQDEPTGCPEKQKSWFNQSKKPVQFQKYPQINIRNGKPRVSTWALYFVQKIFKHRRRQRPVPNRRDTDKRSCCF